MKRVTTVVCYLLLALSALTPARGRGRGMADLLEQYRQEVDKWLAEVKAHPKDATARFHLGEAYENLQEDDGQAKELAAFSEAIRLNPDYAEAYKKRARIYLNTSKEEKAVADYSQLIRLDPKDAYAYVMRAGGYASMKENEKALADYDEAVRADPKLAQAYYGRAVIYELKGETDKALADYTSAIQFAKPAAPGQQADVEDAFDVMGEEALGRRARLYLKTGQWDKAIAEYTGMMQPSGDGSDGDEDYYDVYICRALAYRGKGENEKALADYTAAAKSDSAEQADRDFAHMGRGEVYAAMGEKEKALADFAKAVEIHPYTDDYIELGITQYSAGQFDNVIKTCNTEIEVCDAGIEAYELRGAARAAKGDAKKAAADYKEAVERGRDACLAEQWKNAEGIDSLAAAESRMGKSEEAALHEQMALDLAHAGKTDAKTIKAMEGRLALYQQKKPYLMEKDKDWTSPASDMLPMDF